MTHDLKLKALLNAAIANVWKIKSIDIDTEALVHLLREMANEVEAEEDDESAEAEAPDAAEIQRLRIENGQLRKELEHIQANHPNRPKNEERAVLVTTAHRGVFFGYATETDGAVIKLRAARNCIYWPPENKGFLGLATEGPKSGARVGPAADIELRDITCVAACTDKAVEAWEKAPWK
jgi:hypothetical protein